MNKNNQSRQSLKNHAYQLLKEKLVDCIYPPGSLLNEAQLAKEMELSRTPIRESISKLEMEGFIKVIPKKGIYVTDITFNDVIQVFQARVEMEPIALRLAAPHLPLDELKNFSQKFHEPIVDVHNSFRLDTAMHLFIIEYCGNRFIINTMKRVFEENTRIIISSKQNQAKVHDAKEEHLEILNKLIDGKYAEAEQCMLEHIKSCRISALEYFYNNQLYTPVPSNDYKKELDKL
ncbi:FCD domain-containing protein [Iocasia frigidifontis]|uniref:FCD domain-containing protein n=1 Tax=Iocasia fonsfrigidae TaxID=2682810 RepID=A0A8A7KG55_9FIRM|nr:GntR family transcriptional regulator [Iocasia fonsfrigidae]QTL97144.1 FCD domain-containing protein [Iocasia fonsfrigidae]